jgi:U3 small nucleolar RNA-associated protein 23
MQQYGLSFGFREPYQVIRKFPALGQLQPTALQLLSFCAVDAEIIRTADRFKMDLVAGLERTLQGQVKPSKFPSSSSSF